MQYHHATDTRGKRSKNNAKGVCLSSHSQPRSGDKPKKSPGQGPGLLVSTAPSGVDGSLLEQRQHSLRQLVGLGQHGGSGLLDDLRAGQLGGGGSIVGVQNSAA